MRLHFASEHRFVKYQGGYYDRGVHVGPYWKPYLEVFDELVLVARARPVEHLEEGYQRVDVDGVSFHEVPDYKGSWRAAGVIPAIARATRDAIEQADAVILRLPSNIIGHLLWWYGRQKRVPLGIEMGGDLWDASRFDPLPLRLIRRGIMIPLIQAECREADIACYVTEDYLQRRFPPKGRAFSWTDAVVCGDSLRSEPRSYQAKQHLRLAYTANFVRYKAHSLLFETLVRAQNAGLDWELTLIGGGPLRQETEEQAKTMGISDRVSFAGLRPNTEVLRILEGSDLYITTSLAEGLPRAIVEAQSRALPVVGFNVGGIPELVPESQLVKPGDIEGLAKLLVDFSESPKLLADASLQSLQSASRFTLDVHRPRRLESYRALREIAEARLNPLHQEAVC